MGEERVQLTKIKSFSLSGVWVVKEIVAVLPLEKGTRSASFMIISVPKTWPPIKPDGLPSLVLSNTDSILIPIADPNVGAPKTKPEMAKL